MYKNESVQYHAQLELEHRAMASHAASAAVQHYHAIMADHHAAKAYGVPSATGDARQQDAR